MLPDGSIRIEHLWKGFRADVGRRLLRDQVARVADRMRGRGAPRDYHWVLRDLTCAVEPGESVGLVGRNGSGKSTLLRLVSSVMYPGYGRIEVRGRIGALIEVTSGIHPDLTGRENVIVYGSLLGWRRADVMRRFDDIVSFAGVSDAIDRHVKFYSSGMKMRLGFAIAAFLEPAILLVDEVLAVGDAAFQQQCLERMRLVLAGGTTLVFVSHDLNAVGSTCQRGLWLADGVLQADGPVDAVLDSYRRAIESEAAVADRSGAVRVVCHAAAGPGGEPLSSDAPWNVELELDSDDATPAAVLLGMSEGEPTPIFVLRHDLELPAGRARLVAELPSVPLPGGEYYLWFAAHADDGRELAPWQPLGPVHIDGPELAAVPPGIVRGAPVYVEAHWRRDP